VSFFQSSLLLLLQAEQLEHWQRNRRQLAFSTVGTPDYIAPEVRRVAFFASSLREVQLH
jgi:hypothetical protein